MNGTATRFLIAAGLAAAVATATACSTPGRPAARARPDRHARPAAARCEHGNAVARPGPAGDASGAEGGGGGGAAGGGWRVSLLRRGAGAPEFTAVTAVSATSAWAFTSNEDLIARPTAWLLSGRSWTRYPFPGRRGESVVAARASSAANVWAFTSMHRALRWNGCAWSVLAGFPARDVTDAVVVSRTDAWVLPGGWHFDGRRWTRSVAARGLARASAVLASDIWAVGAIGSRDATVVAHWDGVSWHRTDLAALLPTRTTYCAPTVGEIYAGPAGAAWAVGEAFCQDVAGPAVLLRYAGGAWHRVARLGSHDTVPGGVLPDGRGGLWIPVDPVQVGHAAILHYSGGTVTSALLPTAGQLLFLDAAAAPGGAGAFAVGRDWAGRHIEAIVLRFG